MDIIKTIRDNKLIYLTFDKLVQGIKKFSQSDEGEIRGEINSLLHSGDLFLDSDGKISISADRGYIKAKISVNRKGYGFASVEGMPDFFIPAHCINGAFSGDDVLVEITKHVAEDDFEAKVVRVLSRNTTHVVGTYIEGKTKNVVFPDDDKLPQIRIFKPDNAGAKNNDKVWVEIDTNSIEKNSMNGKIIEVLGRANTPKAEQLSIIRSFNLDEHFPDIVLNEAKKINQNVEIKNFKNRVDYTNLRVITIDGEDARDFDDAISIEPNKNGGYTLYIHIADVSNYVVENSVLDKEAYKRGTSVYFPNQVIPMLPKELSNGVCSLSEGKNRLVLTIEICLDKDFNVLTSTIKEGIIRSLHRMTYTEIMGILAGNELLIEKYSDVYEDILTYQKISNKLKLDRLKRGEIRMNLPEPFILENEAGEIISIENRFPDEAHEIIESLMILANECVAKKFCELGVPFVYRVHEKPDEEKVNRLSDLLKNMGVANQLNIDGDQPMSYQKIIDKISGIPQERTLTKLILRTMMKARYAPNCLGHFGLASEFYCHFTSPIRRYPDLLIHRIIKSYLNGVPKEELKIKFKPVTERASEQSSTAEKNADEAEREVDDYKKAVYMTKFLGEQFAGTISSVQEFGIFVELDNGVEGLVKLDYLPMDEYTYDELSLTLAGKTHHYSIGDKVEVIVASANTHLRQVDFELVGVDKNLGSFVVKKEQKKTTKSKSHKTKNQTKQNKIKFNRTSQNQSERTQNRTNLNTKKSAKSKRKKR